MQCTDLLLAEEITESKGNRELALSVEIVNGNDIAKCGVGSTFTVVYQPGNGCR